MKRRFPSKGFVHEPMPWDNAIYQERLQTVYWYERMSGQKPWANPSKAKYLPMMEKTTASVNRMMASYGMEDYQLAIEKNTPG